MKVNYSINSPQTYGTSITFDLTEEDTNRSGTLVADLRPFFDFAPDYQDKVAFDLFIIAIIVYGIDNLLDRYIYSTDGWTREIETTFPVSNPEAWERVKDELEKTLCFLTGDIWSINFETTPFNNEYYRDNVRRRKRPNFTLANTEYNTVSLFSGGLDSLIGIVDYFAENPSSKLLLVSHYDSNSSGPNSDQRRLVNRFDSAYPNNFHWIQINVGLRLSTGVGREPSYRSRSLMFIALGVYFASRKPETELIIPENGTISLNHPLSASRRGSLSTRTTHPYLLMSLRQLFSRLGINVNLRNPYELQTKGEMMRQSRNPSFIQGALIDSVSCGKRGRKKHWDARDGISHCGHCMPCIYRRAALNMVGLDTQQYGIDIFNPVRGWDHIKNLPDISALVNYMKASLSDSAIARNLLINATFSMDDLPAFVSVVRRTKQEIEHWVREKASAEIQRDFGL